MAEPKTARIGEVRFNNQNERMEIIAYKRADCITVRFDNGAVRHNVQYHNFCEGRVRKPDAREIEEFQPIKQNLETEEIKESQSIKQKSTDYGRRTDRIGEVYFNLLYKTPSQRNRTRSLKKSSA